MTGFSSDILEMPGVDRQGTLRLRQRPLVVLDWGWLRALTEPFLLHTAFNYLLPDVAFQEAMDSSNARHFADVLRHVVNANEKRLYLGKYWNHVVDDEIVPGKVVPVCDVMTGYVHTTMGGKRVSAEEWYRRAQALHAQSDDHRRAKEGFRTLRDNFVGNWDRWSAGLEKRSTAYDINEQKQLIQNPDVLLDLIAAGDDRYLTEAWRKALAVFPDHHAVGRIFRIWVWHCMRGTRIKSEKRLGNDSEDAAYIFLASYADQFWTCDRDAADTVNTLFPNTRVICRAPQEVRRFRATDALSA